MLFTVQYALGVESEQTNKGISNAKIFSVLLNKPITIRRKLNTHTYRV